MYGKQIELHVCHVVSVDVLRATPTEQRQTDECTICGHILPRTFLLGTHMFFAIMTKKGTSTHTMTFKSVILSKWNVDLFKALTHHRNTCTCIERIFKWSKHAAKIHIFSILDNMLKSTSNTASTTPNTYNQHLNLCQWTKQYYTGLCVPFMYSTASPTWVPVTLAPLGLSLGSFGAQDQCPPGWQMALMKLDNSAYMHKRMLNIDSEDQRSGAYSTL